MIKIKEKEYQCAMEVTIDLIGGKWKALILWHLADRTMRFNEIKRLMPQVTQKMLTQQLRDLEESGLVHREVYPEVPPKVEYSLTEFGKSLKPVMNVMCQWGRDYIDNVNNKL